MSHVLFSIIIPSYNREFSIINALDSTRLQNYADRIEINIIDDSTDNTPVRVRDYASQYPEIRINLIQPKVHAGLAGARNLGISLSCGEYLVFLDSDDELVPGALQRIEDIISKYDCAIYFGAVTPKSGREIEYPVDYSNRLINYEEYLRTIDSPESLPVIKNVVLKQHDLLYDRHFSGFEFLLYLRILRLGYNMFRDTKVSRLFDDLDRKDRHSSPKHIMSVSSGIRLGYIQFLKEFGEDLSRVYPKYYQRAQLKGAVYSKLSSMPLDDLFVNHLIKFIDVIPNIFIRWAALRYKQLQIWKGAN